MSQAGILSITSSPSVATSFVTDSGTAIPALNTLRIVGGSGIATSGATNVVTISMTGSPGLIWSDTSAIFPASSNHGYFITAAATSTLPAAPAEGDVVAYVLDAPALMTITANAGQKIRVGTALSAIAGTAAASVIGSSIYLVFRAATSVWFSLSAPEGTFTIT